jgi:hypothetical protein
MSWLAEQGYGARCVWQLLDQLRGWPGGSGDLIALVAGLLYAEAVGTDARTAPSFVPSRAAPAYHTHVGQLSSAIRHVLAGDRLIAPALNVLDRLIRESPRPLLAIVLDWLRELDRGVHRDHELGTSSLD